MPKTNRCSFCGKDFPPATGLLYIRNDGTLHYFCSRKCRKSQLFLRRDPRRLKWTAFYGKKEKGR